MKPERSDKMPDRKLIKQITEGNELAFSALFERYWESLLDTAFRVIEDRDLAQDIVQEVFTELWNKREKLSIESVTPYLHQSTRYAVFRAIRKSKMIFKDLDALETPMKVNNTEEQLDFQELTTLMERSISELPEQRQRVFRLSRFEHLSNREIAQQLNISVKTVDNHIAKALQALRYRYNDMAWLWLMLSLC